MASHIRISRSKYPHEEKAQDDLSKAIGEEWLVLSNPPRNRTILEIDCILIGPKGCFVVELKDWVDGTEADDANPWTLNGKVVAYTDGPKKNPVVQAHDAGREFKKKLLKDNIKIWIDSISIAGPLGLNLKYTSEYVKDVVRPIQQANALLSRRIALGGGDSREGCKPLSTANAILILQYFGVFADPKAQRWLATAYPKSAPAPAPTPAPVPLPTPAPARPSAPTPSPTPAPKKGKSELQGFLLSTLTFIVGSQTLAYTLILIGRAMMDYGNDANIENFFIVIPVAIIGTILAFFGTILFIPSFVILNVLDIEIYLGV